MPSDIAAIARLAIQRSTYLLAWARPQKCRVRRIILSSHFGRMIRFPFLSHNITQWFAKDFCMSHSSHLQVWISDMKLVLSPVDEFFAQYWLCGDSFADDQTSAASSIGSPPPFL